MNRIKFTRASGEVKTIAYESKQVECRDVGCRRKSFWIEFDENGTGVFCFAARHDGERHAVKLSVEDIEREIKNAG